MLLLILLYKISKDFSSKIQKQPLLLLICSSYKSRNRSYTIQKQPLLLLIDKKELIEILYPNSKTTFVTVNRVVMLKLDYKYRYSKTTFVTVNLLAHLHLPSVYRIQKQPLLLLIKSTILFRELII